jgi:thioredoxin-related protein
MMRIIKVLMMGFISPLARFANTNKNTIRLFAVAIVLLNTNFICSQGIRFFEGSYEEAKTIARQTQRAIFVDVYTSWCGPCKMLSKKVFSEQKVGDFYNQNFICLKLDAEKQKDHPFFKDYEASAFPSLFWLSAEGELLQTKIGFVDVDAFIQLGLDSKGSTFNQELKALEKRWKDGERTPDLVQEYLLETLVKVTPSKVEPLMKEYLEGLSREQLLNSENYPFLKYSPTSYDGSIANRTLLLEHEHLVQHEANPNEYWARLYRRIVRSGAITRKDTPEKYDSFKQSIAESGSDLAPMYLDVMTMEEQLFDGKFSEVLPTIIPFIESQAKQHHYLYSELFYTLIIVRYFKTENNPATNEDIVLEIAKRAMKHEPCKRNLMYIAAVHAHKGNVDEAYYTLASLPFFGGPMLSNALYGALNIPFVGREYR